MGEGGGGWGRVGEGGGGWGRVGEVEDIPHLSASYLS